MEKKQASVQELEERYPELKGKTVEDIMKMPEYEAALATTIRKMQKRNIFGLPAHYILAFRSLDNDGAFEPERFRREYIACLSKTSTLPSNKRAAILALGSHVGREVIQKLMAVHDNAPTLHRTDDAKIPNLAKGGSMAALAAAATGIVIH